MADSTVGSTTAQYSTIQHSWVPLFIDFEENYFFPYSSLSPFVSTIHDHFSSRSGILLNIHSSSTLYDNLFLFFLPLYNHFKPFLKFQNFTDPFPPVYLDFERTMHHDKRSTTQYTGLVQVLELLANCLNLKCLFKGT